MHLLRHVAGMPVPSISPGHHALRKGRCSQAQQIYLLTMATCGRAPIFADWRCAWAASASLAAADSWPCAELLCWVLMPDHWHGLVRLRPGATLAALMQRAKGRSARAINQARGRGGPVWARAFHDHALRRDEDLLRSARYVVANPLRAGLVERVGDYPYWDAIWLSAP